MIRKRFRRRPELESLETMVLLSGLSVLEHPGVVAIAAQGRARRDDCLGWRSQGNLQVERWWDELFQRQGVAQSTWQSGAQGVDRLRRCKPVRYGDVQERGQETRHDHRQPDDGGIRKSGVLRDYRIDRNLCG